MLSTPVCIIGAGPAGATASLFLSKAGIQHTIIDKANFPRDKICGDAIDALCMRVMNTYDKRLVEEITLQPDVFSPSMGVKFVAPNGKEAICYHHPDSKDIPSAMYFVAKRFDFDFFLVNKLNPNYADIQLGATVTDIERRKDGIIVTYTKGGILHQVFTKLLLGADGDHSIVLRKLSNRKIDRNYYAAAVRMYCKNIKGIEKGNLIELFYLKNIPLGYLWIFPLANNICNVGMGLGSNHASKLKFNLVKEFEKIITTDEVLAPRFENCERLESPKGWGLPMAGGNRDIVGDNYLLLGDAASLINPLNGEGVGSAMVSGWAAAQFAEKALVNNQFDANSMQPYQHQATYRLNTETRFYNNFAKIVPSSIQHISLNLFIGSGFAKKLFEKEAKKWMNNAFNTPLEIKW
ncbi:MAG: geranylgeranyl reductase family protein [Sphingobacteriia bacterium]|jgi:geranylgeranyl reductase family protein